MVALQTSMQFLKFRIKPDLHMTVSKKTFKAGIHGPFSPRNARSELIKIFNYLIFFGLDRPEIPLWHHPELLRPISKIARNIFFPILCENIGKIRHTHKKSAFAHLMRRRGPCSKKFRRKTFYAI